MLKINLPLKSNYLKIAEDIDFYGLFQKITREFETCFILESLGVYSDLSRYSIIGFEPGDIIKAKEDKLIINKNIYSVNNPYFSLRKIIPQNIISRDYCGGLVGYLSYEAMNYFEPSLNIKVHPLFDQFVFGVYPDGLIFDKLTNEVFYFYFEKDRSDLIRKIIKSKPYKNEPLKVSLIGDTLNQKEHLIAVNHVKEHILSGDTFQCQVGFKTEFRIKGDTLDIYSRLRNVNPSPHMYYLKFGNKKIIGASPELLFRMRGGVMETYPLAGTIKRGKNDMEDKKLARNLLNNPKEIAEHNMLVDLHRNDIGRVAEFGTVKIQSLMDIKKFSHVQHISSEIVGVIKKDEDMFSAFSSNFPAGTLTGAPKIESMKIIDRFEKDARGPYGGALGHFGFNGDCTFAIPIRSLFVAGDYAYTQTSGGIVYDSQPEKEYEEIQNKLRAMKEVLLR